MRRESDACGIASDDTTNGRSAGRAESSPLNDQSALAAEKRDRKSYYRCSPRRRAAVSGANEPADRSPAPRFSEPVSARLLLQLTPSCVHWLFGNSLGMLLILSIKQTKDIFVTQSYYCVCVGKWKRKDYAVTNTNVCGRFSSLETSAITMKH